MGSNIVAITAFHGGLGRTQNGIVRNATCICVTITMGMILNASWFTIWTTFDLLHAVYSLNWSFTFTYTTSLSDNIYITLLSQGSHCSHIGHTPLSLSQWSLSYFTLSPTSLFSYSLSWSSHLHSHTMVFGHSLHLSLVFRYCLQLYTGPWSLSTSLNLYIFHWSLVTLSVSHSLHHSLVSAHSLHLSLVPSHSQHLSLFPGHSLCLYTGPWSISSSLTGPWSLSLSLHWSLVTLSVSTLVPGHSLNHSLVPGHSPHHSLVPWSLYSSLTGPWSLSLSLHWSLVTLSITHWSLVTLHHSLVPGHSLHLTGRWSHSMSLTGYFFSLWSLYSHHFIHHQ